MALYIIIITSKANKLMEFKMTKVRSITSLEAKFIKVVVESANFEYSAMPASFINGGETVKKNQFNALINNLKAIGMLIVRDDLFDKRLIELTHRGKHAFRNILRDESRLQAIENK